PSKVAFAENVQSTFRLHVAPGRVLEAVLTELEEGRPSPRHEQFSLFFRAPVDAPVQQGIYRLEHAQNCAFDLFMLPIDRDANGVYYQAVFNRLVDQGT